MSYGMEIFPIITTKKIDISTQRKIITVDFCLNIPFSRSTLSNYKEMSQLLNYYFFILDDRNVFLLSDLQRKDTRARVMQQIFRGNIAQQGRKAISLGHIMQNHITNDFAVSDLSNDYNNEIRMRTEIYYNPGVEYQRLRTNNLHLVAFAHTPVDADRAFAPGVGGDSISYDLLLTKNSGEAILSTPEFIDTFYINDPVSLANNSSVPGGTVLQPYFGAVHYHGPENPGRDGYIGWMAGAPGEDMGPKLEIRTIRNYKISSDLPLVSSPNQPGMFASDSSGYELTPVSQLKSKLKYNNLLKTRDQLLADLSEHAKKNCLRKPNIVDYGTQDASFISLVNNPDTGEQSPLEDSHHGCIAGINFLDLVRYRSRLGYIMDFHYAKSNHQFVAEYIYRSRIRNLNITRYRTTNQPLEINERQSKKYGPYDKNEQATFIIESSDRDDMQVFSSYVGKLKHRLKSATSNRGSIEEVELYTLSSLNNSGQANPTPGPRYSRQFVIRDRDLFHNIRFGNYTYDVEITVEDGVHSSISLMHEVASNTLKEYGELVFRARIPSNAQGPGNYDYLLREFSEEFKQDENNNLIISKSIDLYKKIILFLTGERVTSESQRTLSRNLELQSAKLEDILEFENILTTLVNSVKSILSAGISLPSDKLHNMEKTSVKNSTGLLTNAIKVKSPLGVYVEAFSEDTVLADYGLPNFNYSFESPILNYLSSINSRLLRSTSDQGQSLLLRPHRFITVSTPSIETTDGGMVQTGRTLAESKARHDDRKPMSNRTKNKSAISPLSTFTDYQFSPLVKKTNQSLKIKYLIKSQSTGQVGESSKPNSYFGPAIQRNFGGIVVGLSKGGITSFTGDYGIESRFLEYATPGLSSEIKKVLCESVYTAKDKEHFLEEAARRYRDLISVRNGLGAFYEAMHNSLLMKSLAYARNISSTNYSDVFENGEQTVTRPQSSLVDVYDEQVREIEVVLPGREKVKLQNLKIDPTPLVKTTQIEKKVICVNYAPAGESTMATPINNVALLGV
jgi:hypothetical protein